MKKLIVSLVLCFATIPLFAKQLPDTIAISQSDVSNWIIEDAINSKGKPTKKYYCVFKGKLIPTNKTTIQSVELCKKYNAECSLILITSTKRKQRITIN